MNWYLAIKFLHITAVIMLIGGVFARQLIRGVAKKSGDIKLVASLTQIVRRLDTTMIIPGSNAALVLGIPLRSSRKFRYSVSCNAHPQTGCWYPIFC